MENPCQIRVQGRSDPEVDEEAEGYERDAGNNFDESSGRFAAFFAVSNRAMLT